MSRIVEPKRSISVGPASSDCSSRRPPTRSRGRIAIASTMIPIPPSQCESWRQNCVASLSCSTCGTTVPPVAVKPDIASK